MAQLAIGFRGTKLGGSAFDKSDGEFPAPPASVFPRLKPRVTAGLFVFLDKRGEVMCFSNWGPSSRALVGPRATHVVKMLQKIPIGVQSACPRKFSNKFFKINSRARA
jgi:hypothetical protein